MDQTWNHVKYFGAGRERECGMEQAKRTTVFTEQLTRKRRVAFSYREILLFIIKQTKKKEAKTLSDVTERDPILPCWGQGWRTTADHVLVDTPCNRLSWAGIAIASQAVESA